VARVAIFPLKKRAAEGVRSGTWPVQLVGGVVLSTNVVRGVGLGERNRRLVAWFQDLRKPLRRFIARRRNLSAADLDDVAQEVFFRILRYDRQDLVSDPTGYLFTVAANVASEWSMRAHRSLPHESSWLDDLIVEPDPGETLDRERRDRDLKAALACLAPRTREVMRLHFSEGLPHAAIAKLMNITPRTVKRDIVNGCARLRLALCADADRPPCSAPLADSIPPP